MKTIMTRRAVLAGLGPAVATLLAACQPGQRPGGPPAPAAPKVSGTVIFRDWRAPTSAPQLERWYQFVQDEFTQRYPGTRVEFEFVPWGREYLDKFTVSVASGTPPDALTTSIIWARDWWDEGALEDLTPYVARTPDVAMEKFIPAALFYNQKQGKIYGLPQVGPDFNVIYYRPSFFREAGLDPALERLASWSWDDFLGAAQKLTRTEGGEIVRAGFVGPGMDIERFTSWTYSNGGTFYNQEFTRVAFNTEKTAQAVQLQIDIRDKYRIFATRPGMSGLAQFYAGACAMLWAGNWNIRSITEAIQRGEAPADLDFNIMAVPRGPQGTRQATTAWVNMTTMPRTARNKEGAWALQVFLSSAPTAVKQLEIQNVLSPRKDFFESPEFKAISTRIPAHAQQRRIADLGGSYAFIRFTQVTDRILPLLRDAYDGKLPIKDALAEAERQANEVLAQVR
jgi:multiple sugar transport system substrate-binding protein